MPSTVQEDKEEAEPNVAVTMASVTELVESGLTPYMAGKLVASRNAFIASEVEGGAAEGEVWRRLKSWDEFWEAMDDTGLRGIGPAKQLKLRTTGVYFGNRNLNAMDDKELEELLGDDAEAVSAVLGDPEEAEGAESIAELLEKLPETTRKDKVVQRLVQAALYVSPRQLSNLNDAALWTSDALDAVPGIGPKTVAKIVAARAERPRGFATWEEVPVTRGKLRALIRAGLTVEQAGSKDEVRIHENQAIIAKKVEQKLSEEAGAKGDGPTTTSGGTAAAEEKEDGHGAAGEDGQLLELSPEISNGKTSTGSGPTGAEEGSAGVEDGDGEGAQSEKGRQRLMDDVWAPGKGSAGSGSCGTKHPVDIKPEEEEAVGETAAVGKYWWQLSGQEDLPFPLYFVDCEEGEGCKRAGGRCACQRGRFSYRMLTEEERRMSEEEAAVEAVRLNALFPKIPSNAPETHRETMAYRSGQTGRTEVRQRCWRDLLTYEATDRIPKKWRDTFRVDPYGNVVALGAYGLSACAFEVDHIFPWSRGGLSQPVNFMALYWGANRHVKSDDIPNTFSATRIDRMQCGLSVDNFLELLAQGDAIQKRSARLKYFQQAKYLLLSCIGTPSSLQTVLQPGQVCATLLRHQQVMLDDLFPPGEAD